MNKKEAAGLLKYMALQNEALSMRPSVKDPHYIADTARQAKKLREDADHLDPPSPACPCFDCNGILEVQKVNDINNPSAPMYRIVCSRKENEHLKGPSEVAPDVAWREFWEAVNALATQSPEKENT